MRKKITCKTVNSARKTKAEKTVKFTRPSRASNAIPSWNVWIWSFNDDMLEKYDVVPALFAAIIDRKKSLLPDNFEDFNEILHSEAMYYYWSKCECEMLITDWPPHANTKKVDIYEQLSLNWDIFAAWFWDNIYNPIVLKGKGK